MCSLGRFGDLFLKIVVNVVGGLVQKLAQIAVKVMNTLIENVYHPIHNRWESKKLYMRTQRVCIFDSTVRRWYTELANYVGRMILACIAS